MNAIDELVRGLASVAEDDADERTATDYARRRLRAAMADPQPRRRWSFAVPFAAAAALAAVILAVVALLPGNDASAPAPASAAVALEAVARVAATKPAEAYPGPRQYLYLKFREGWTLVERGIAFESD